MNLSEFDFDLPDELIAQEGLRERDSSRLMVMHPDGRREHLFFRDILSFFKKGDLLVMNDTRVLPARLIGRKSSGGKVDVLVLSPENDRASVGGGHQEAFIRGSNIKPGTRIEFGSPGNGGEDKFFAEVTELVSGARFRVKFSHPDKIHTLAQLPIPPYIKKPLENPERYQTVYSKNSGSLAAPTAGLHFTPELFKLLEAKGVELARITLHVGMGTFAPIRTEKVEDWKMHAEHYSVNAETAEKINACQKDGRRLFAVGTTTIRTLESVASDGAVHSGESWSEIFIYPGYEFKLKYAGMVTNFHLPQSTLILLTSAFAGREKLLAAYKDAVQLRYRFYSLGDAMLILK